MAWSTCHEHGTKKKSESPTGIEPMTFCTPVGCSNHWATKDSWRAGLYTRLMYDMLLRTARISISLMILAVCTMHVIYEFCIWSSSPHNTNTSETVSHISNSISGSIFWLVLQKPQYRNRVICFCAYPFNYQMVIVEERPIKISWERLKRVENIHCLKSQKS